MIKLKIEKLSMRSLLRNLVLPGVLMMALSAHAALNTIVNPTLSTSVVDASVPTVSYTYNYLGQRVSKTVTQNTLPPTSATTYYEYNDQGNLLGEYNANGNPLRQYVYLNGERVAMFDYSSGSKQTVYLANNHVGQMQYAWNSSGVLVDTRVQAPFGETASETPTGGLQIPVRFPGQVADSETGYSQNWNRDYDPSTGRYLESDPIGLAGGINTYGYANGNPVMFDDMMGLMVTETCRPTSQAKKWGWPTPVHCSVIVWHWEEKCPGQKQKVIDAQYSLEKNGTTPTKNPNSDT